MKIIYKSLMTIAFAGLSLASCDKELKEETAMEVGVVTDSNVSFDGKTVTVKKGNPVTFSFDGDPDFISFLIWSTIGTSIAFALNIGADVEPDPLLPLSEPESVSCITFNSSYDANCCCFAFAFFLLAFVFLSVACVFL